MSAATLERVRERIATTAPDEVRLRTLLVLAHELLRQRALLEEAAVPRAYEPGAAADGGDPVESYDELVERIRAVALGTLPPGARVLVVSRGDDGLLAPGLAAAHFPQGPDGRYAGYHPADSDAAITQLEQCRADGAEFLLIPSTGYWWLDYYGGLLQHLMGRGRVHHHDGHCVIFDLRREQ